MNLVDQISNLIEVAQDLRKAVINMECDDSMSAFTTYDLVCNQIKEAAEFIKEL